MTAISAAVASGSYAAAGRADLARKKYQGIIDEFPGASYAEAARSGMSRLEGQ